MVHFVWCVAAEKNNRDRVSNKVEGENGCLRMGPHTCCGMCTPYHTHMFVHRNTDYIHPHTGTPISYTCMCVHTNIDCIHTQNISKPYRHIWMHIHRETLIYADT